MRPPHLTHVRIITQTFLVLSMACVCTGARGQVSLSTAIDLALKTDSRVKIAQDTARRSLAVVQETRDAYIPSAAANGGVGYSYGITLNIPTIFTFDVQSLVYSPTQRSYMRASRWGLEAANTALRSAREAVEEDLAITYISLDLAQQSSQVMAQEYDHAVALAAVVERRRDAGVESDLEWKQARRTAAQIHLQLLQMQDQVEDLQQHLSQLTGLPATNLQVVSASIPQVEVRSSITADTFIPLDTVQAQMEAKARAERASGDAHGVWKPQINMFSQYGRVSPINSVSDYYNLRGRYNTFSIGASIHFPIFDAVARARQREAQSDMQRTRDELQSIALHGSDDHRKLRHSLTQLSARMEVAELDASIAEDQLRIVRRQADAGGDVGPVMTPRDVEQTSMQERQRYADLLDARLQLRKTQIFYLRQSGQLQSWIDSARQQSSTSPSARP